MYDGISVQNIPFMNILKHLNTMYLYTSQLEQQLACLWEVKYCIYRN